MSDLQFWTGIAHTVIALITFGILYEVHRHREVIAAEFEVEPAEVTRSIVISVLGAALFVGLVLL